MKTKKPATKVEYFRAVIYEILIDPLLEKVRGLIAGFVPEKSIVIDIGCGTGTLAFRLAEDRGCTVQGIDLAPEKIARARRRKAGAHFPKVHFMEEDATHLTGISDQQFDCATISLLIHSLPENVRRQVIREAMRVAKQIVIADYVANQPMSFPGIVVRGIERMAGNEHFANFNSFRATKGLDPLLKEAGLVIVDERVNASGTIQVIIALCTTPPSSQALPQTSPSASIQASVSPMNQAHNASRGPGGPLPKLKDSSAF